MTINYHRSFHRILINLLKLNFSYSFSSSLFFYSFFRWFCHSQYWEFWLCLDQFFPASFFPSLDLSIMIFLINYHLLLMVQLFLHFPKGLNFNFFLCFPTIQNYRKVGFKRSCIIYNFFSIFHQCFSALLNVILQGKGQNNHFHSTDASFCQSILQSCLM